MALGAALLGAPAAGAVMTGPTTRDCSVLPIPGVFAGFDPDFVQLQGVSVSAGALTATGPAVTLLASESLVPSDQKQTVILKATLSSPGRPSQSFSARGVGHVSIPITLSPGANTIAWSAGFDDGLHPCPFPLTGTPRKAPFTVTEPAG
jgi:hypothetical protein